MAQTFYEETKMKRFLIITAGLILAGIVALSLVPKAPAAGWCGVEERKVVTRECVGGEMTECTVSCNSMARPDGTFQCQCVVDCYSIGECDRSV